jgi:HNH endonuclease
MPQGIYLRTKENRENIRQARLKNVLPLQVRFWNKVQKTQGCWLWKGARRTSDGYGEFTVKCNPRQRVLSHVFSYIEFHGPILEGREIHHKCENPACVNPAHLIALTRKEHQQHSPKFLAATAAWNTTRRNKTHCQKGHPYDQANTYITANGSRACRICKHQWYLRKKAV